MLGRNRQNKPNGFVHVVYCVVELESPVVVFLDCGHPCFWNFYPIVSVDIVRVKSYVNLLFDPASVTMRITINKLYFIPKRVVSGVVGVL